MSKSPFVQQVWNSPTFTTWVSQGVKLLGLVLLLPMTLSRFTPEEFALWMLFSLLITLQGLLDFGFAPTFVRAIAYSSADMPADTQAPMGGRFDIHGVLAAMAWVYGRMGLAAFAILATLGSLGVMRQINFLDVPLEGWAAWTCVVLTAPVTLRLSMFSAYLQGVAEIALLRRWQALTGLMVLISAIVVVYADGGLLVLVLVWQLGMLVGALVTRAIAVRLLTPAADAPDAAEVKRILTYFWPTVWRSGLGVMVMIGIAQGSGVIYAQLASAEDTGTYLLGMRLILVLRDFANAPFYTRVPTLARLYAMGRKQEMVHVARNGMLATSWLFTVGALMTGILAPVAISFIDSSVSFPSTTLWLLLAAAGLAERIGAMHSQLYSSGNHILWHVANGLTGLAMVGMMPLGYSVLGVIGLPVGLLVAYTLVLIPFSARLTYANYPLDFWLTDFRSSVLPSVLLASWGALAWILA